MQNPSCKALKIDCVNEESIITWTAGMVIKLKNLKKLSFITF